MLLSFAAKTFAAWTFRLIWGVVSSLPRAWTRGASARSTQQPVVVLPVTQTLRTFAAPSETFRVANQQLSSVVARNAHPAVSVKPNRPPIPVRIACPKVIAGDRANPAVARSSTTNTRAFSPSRPILANCREEAVVSWPT